VIATTRAYVGAGRVLRILNIDPLVADPASPLIWPAQIDSLDDRVSGVSLRRGQLAAFVTETPAEASQLADRLGRFVPDVAGVTINGTPLGLFAVSDTRRNIVVSEIEPRLFSGELRYELVPHGDISDGNIMPALEARVHSTSSTPSKTASTRWSKNGVGASPADSVNGSAWCARYSPTPKY